MAETIKSHGEASKVMLTKKLRLCDLGWRVCVRLLTFRVVGKATVELKQSVCTVQDCFSQYPPYIALRSRMMIIRDQVVVTRVFRIILLRSPPDIGIPPCIVGD